MSSMQNGASWWADGFARFPGAGNETTVGESPYVWGTNESASITSVISDVQEEGEVDQSREESEFESPELSAEILSQSTEIQSSAEIVAATAARIGVIESLMRQHQSGGLGTYHQGQTHGDPGQHKAAASMTGDLLQDPGLAFAATIPRQDRLGLISLLS